MAGKRTWRRDRMESRILGKFCMSSRRKRTTSRAEWLLSPRKSIRTGMTECAMSGKRTAHWWMVWIKDRRYSADCERGGRVVGGRQK